MNFKVVRVLTFLACLQLLLAGCSEDFLLIENPNSLDSENFFQTEVDVAIAVNGVYADLQRFPQLFQLYMSEGRSSNYFALAGNAQRDLVDISIFNVNADLSTVEDAWRFGFSLVTKANKVLSVIDEVEFSNTDKPLKLEAEVRALRGYTYFEMMRVFGKLPIVDRLISPEEALNIGRSELADVYAFIVEDMTFAAEHLPTSYPAGELGKITKQAATALLAQVYLSWAQYPLEDRAKASLAIPLLERLSSGDLPMNWATNFEDIFKHENDNEYSLFEVQYISGPSGLGALFPSEFLTSSMQAFPFTGGIPRISPSINLLANFDREADLRFEATFDTSFVDNFFLTVNADIITKWFEPGLILLNRGDWPHNYPVIRPANVYLMLAEALAITNDEPTSEALQALNQTRRRANLPDVELPISKADFLRELQDEYRREFVGEGHFWHYLIRSGEAVNHMNEWFVETSQTLTINEDKLIYPIPFSQLVIKPGLYTQNPGY